VARLPVAVEVPLRFFFSFLRTCGLCPDHSCLLLFNFSPTHVQLLCETLFIMVPSFTSIPPLLRISLFARADGRLRVVYTASTPLPRPVLSAAVLSSYSASPSLSSLPFSITPPSRGTSPTYSAVSTLRSLLGEFGLSLTLCLMSTRSSAYVVFCASLLLIRKAWPFRLSSLYLLWSALLLSLNATSTRHVTCIFF
jgi:hypothetical protein